MSDYGKCQRCGNYGFKDRHACPPPFQVRHESADEEDWRTFYALDAEQAATKWAENYDGYGDYTIAGGTEETVEVKSPDGTVKKYKVAAEQVTEYSAWEA